MGPFPADIGLTVDQGLETDLPQRDFLGQREEEAVCDDYQSSQGVRERGLGNIDAVYGRHDSDLCRTSGLDRRSFLRGRKGGWRVAGSGGIVRFKSDWKVSVSLPQMHGGKVRMVLL